MDAKKEGILMNKNNEVIKQNKGLHKADNMNLFNNTSKQCGKLERIVFHIDVNSAFLSWEACRRINNDKTSVDLRNIPSVVGGSQENRHGIVLAKSTPAKKYGIQTGETLVSAKQKCPNLIVVPPDYELYVNCSRKLIELLRELSPTVEQYSIDEAFVDFTGFEKLYGQPLLFAEELKNKVHSELGFTVNIGVSNNKLLAKMASDFKKPDRVHSLFPWEIQDKMWNLPVGELFYVGKKTEKKLLSLGITTIGELAKADKTMLHSIFKSHGDTIWNYANGNDLEIVTDHQTENKGYGNSITLSQDITDSSTAKLVILSLTETVATRIRADKATISVVSISIVDADFNHYSRQATLLNATNTTSAIYEEACRIFDILWNHNPIRQLGVSTSKATKSQNYQYSIFDYAETNQNNNANEISINFKPDENKLAKSEKLRNLDKAIDDIRFKYGEDSVKRACFLKSDYNHMSGGLDKAKRTGVSGKEV